jgi:hypothetical protein
MFWRREKVLASAKNETKISGSSRSQPCHYNNYAILILYFRYQNDMKTMFQICKLPQHDFWRLHVKKVHSSWIWQIHRYTAHSIISCYAAITPPTQLYQQTSKKKYSLYFWHYSWKSTEYFPHIHVKKRVVLMEYTTLMKGQSCTSLNWKIREKTNFQATKWPNLTQNLIHLLLLHNAAIIKYWSSSHTAGRI